MDRMEFYRAEILMENLKNYNEEEDGNRKKEEEKYNTNSPSMDGSKIMREAQMKMPSMSNFKMPSIPDFKI